MLISSRIKFMINSSKFSIQQLLRVTFHPLVFTVLTTVFVIFLLIRFTNEQSIKPAPIKVDREFRAAWVATVANINWPSTPGLSTEIQQQEAIKILNNLQANNFNAVIFQVRPQADALYKSELEPWSFYLTGKQGQEPVPFYDPLEFWIEEAHRRGIELHAWLNPYRAHHIKGGEVTPYSVVKTHPDLVVQLELGYHWLIPTKKETIEYSINVVMDIVKRYDIDGIHFDDYFYPYPSYNDGKDFPDSKGFAEYTNNGGKLSREDWRRDHVNIFIKRVYDTIKSEKKYVKFGISPFGIWRPGYPESIEGMDQYEKLYADAKLWLNEGWIDYFAPQLYWKINRYPQSFPLLLNWWEEENTKERHLWPGLHTRQGEDERAIDESINQIMISRAMLSNRPGNIFWNVGALDENPAFSEQLMTGPYKRQALIPTFGWLDNIPPMAPKVQVSKVADKLNLVWSNSSDEIISHWVIYTKYSDRWSYKIVNSDVLSMELNTIEIEILVPDINGNTTSEKTELSHALSEVSVTSIDKAGNESSWKSILVIPNS